MQITAFIVHDRVKGRSALIFSLVMAVLDTAIFLVGEEDARIEVRA